MSGKIWEEIWWISYVVLAVWIVNSVLILYLVIQIDTLVNVQLYSFGLEFSKQWADPYWTMTRLLLVFLGLPMALSVAVFVTGFGKFRKKAKSIMAKRKLEPTKGIAKTVLEEKQQENLEEPQVQVIREEVAEPEKQREETRIMLYEKQKELVVENEPELVQESQTVRLIQTEVPRAGEVSNETESACIKKEPETSIETHGVTSCPNCDKVFNRPFFTLDFSSGKGRIVNLCPFCNQVLSESSDLKNEKTQE
jgi:hypothetical protein